MNLLRVIQSSGKECSYARQTAVPDLNLFKAARVSRVAKGKVEHISNLSTLRTFRGRNSRHHVDLGL